MYEYLCNFDPCHSLLLNIIMLKLCSPPSFKKEQLVIHKSASKVAGSAICYIDCLLPTNIHSF